MTGEEITNANQVEANVNHKSPTFTCHELLWLSIDSGRKKLSLTTRTDSSFSIYKKINLSLTGPERSKLKPA